MGLGEAQCPPRPARPAVRRPARGAFCPFPAGRDARSVPCPQGKAASPFKHPLPENPPEISKCVPPSGRSFYTPARPAIRRPARGAFCPFPGSAPPALKRSRRPRPRAAHCAKRFATRFRILKTAPLPQPKPRSAPLSRAKTRLAAHPLPTGARRAPPIPFTKPIHFQNYRTETFTRPRKLPDAPLTVFCYPLCGPK